MVRRRRWALRDAAHLSGSSEARTCRGGEGTHMRQREAGKGGKGADGLGQKQIHSEKSMEEEWEVTVGGGGVMVVADENTKVTYRPYL